MIRRAEDERRVVIVHNYYQQRGGEDVVFEAEAAMLRDRGWEVTLFTTHNDAVEGVDGFTLARRSVWNAKVHGRLRDVLRAQRPAVVHVHNTLPILSPAVYYAARESGAAVVQTLHNYRLTCVNGLLYRDGHPCTECVGKATQAAGVAHACYRGNRAASAVVALTVGLHRAAGTWRSMIDRYIATTRFAADIFIASGIPEQRIVVKPHFLCDEEVPTPDSRRDGSGPVVFIGRLSEEKGIGVMLAAIRALPREREIAIIGDGPMRDEVITALRGRPAVRWLGQLDRRQVAAQIGPAACVLIPSECYETFGRTVVEAYAHGVPVIASNHGALRSLVRHEVDGLTFVPSDAGDLAAKIERLVCDRELNVRLGIAARRRFVESFTEEANYSALTGIYADAVAVRRTAAA